MKISVIVPVYNMAGDNKLNHCLDSLVAQTIAGKKDMMEIIAVDDCSTDNSPEILKDYEKRYPGLVRVLLSAVNRRQGGAKNLGLSVARGEWIGFIDSDDWVTPDYYERLLTAASAMDADMAGCDYSLVDHYTFEPGEVVHNGKPEQAGILDDAKYRSLILDSGSLVVKIYKRCIVYGELDPFTDSRGKRSPDDSLSAAEGGSAETGPDEDGRVKIFPEGIFYEDNAVSVSWMLRASCYAYIPEPLYFYYQHGGSTVHTVNMNNLHDRVVSSRILADTVLEEGYLARYHGEIEFTFTMLFYVNTLFSALQAKNRLPGLYGFIRKLRDEQRQRFPDFMENPYIMNRLDAEQKRMLRMHSRSQPVFLLYYRLLAAYRSWRYGY